MRQEGSEEGAEESRIAGFFASGESAGAERIQVIKDHQPLTFTD
jgi:hypothetical protein